VGERRKREKQGIPVPGTKLIRDWNGDRYTVTILHDGLEYDGAVFGEGGLKWNHCY
jgi:hypothetical protein